MRQKRAPDLGNTQTQMNDPLIGRQLANFRVERVLDRGGMAQVYYGHDIKLQRPVAIKVIDARYRDNPAYARRFVNEARVIAKWHHEHILQIYYADDEDGLYYYVMEYIDGQNLASVIASYSMDGELMPTDDVLQIGNAVANALDYAHGKGVIHRDVKPANILIARDGRVVLGDFGLALDLHDGSLGETFGTPHYISPEQASRSANAVPQSDLYSLGVILYEMLVGVVPFNDPSPTSVALQHITDPPPAPRSINPELSPEVEEVLLKALEKSPQDRYQSGSELMSALNASLAAKPTKAKPPLPPLPVGVPTIVSRPRSKDLLTKRVAPKALEEQVARQAADERPRDKKRKRKPQRFSLAWFLFFCFLFLGAFGFAWWQGWLQFGAFSKLTPLQIVPTAETKMGAAAASNTPTPLPTMPRSPTMTYTPLSSPTEVILPVENTITPLPSPTSTYTAVPTDTLAPMQTATRALTPTPTLLAGQELANLPFKLYYNENSLYFHNLSDITRSISGFTFERLDDNGEVLNFFGGWDWGVYYSNITPDRCMAIELYLSPPFLRPSECREPYLSKLNPPREDKRVFWTTQEGSHEFRVNWQGEEIGRCQTGTGVCEFSVPYYLP